MSWKRNAHKKKHLKLASQLVTCLQTLYFLLEVIKNSYEKKTASEGFIDHKHDVEFFPKKRKNRTSVDGLL